MKAKVLITGASGFVGQNLVPQLAEDNSIKTLGRASADYSWSDLSQIAPELFTYIHLAGKAHDTSNTTQESEYFKVNTDLTIALFERFLQTKAHTFIFMSSVKAVADKVQGPLTEKHTPQPHTPYGQSKHKAEEYLLQAKLPPGKRLIILRPCMIHGLGNKGNLNLLYQVVRKGIPWPLAGFVNHRSFLSVDNLCFVIQRILKDDKVPSGIYHVADDESLSTNELVRIIAESSGNRPRLMALPPGLVRTLAKAGDFLNLPLNSERLKKLTESYIVSNEKLKAALLIERMPLSARKGLQKTLKSFQQ